MAERAGRETPNLDVEGSNLIRCKVLLIRGLFLFLRFSIYKGAFLSWSRYFCRGLASVCEAQLRLCVKFLCKNVIMKSLEDLKIAALKASSYHEHQLQM